jgi:hypothetical protein
MAEQLTPFAAAVETLSPLGIRLEIVPGAYRINFKAGKPATAQEAGDLAAAIELGRDMAKHPPAPPLPPMGPCGRKNTRRGLMMVHNRKIAARRRMAAARAAREAEHEV